MFEDLEDGLDALMILERAVQKTSKSHVPQVDQCTSSSGSRSPSPFDGSQSRSQHPRPPRDIRPSYNQPRESFLYEGSFTALVAILEHPSSSRLTQADIALFGPQPVSGKTGQPEVSTDGVVIRIGHLGDCMSMVIRGKEIVWRTEEM